MRPNRHRHEEQRPHQIPSPSGDRPPSRPGSGGTKRKGEMRDCGPDTSSGAAPVVCVDNSRSVIDKIANLYAERIMSDVCLVVGDAEYQCHRLILCASSDVFQVMLMNPSWTESKAGRVELGEAPACANVFEDFLKYFYTGRIRLDYSNVVPLVGLADKYNVTDLLHLSLDYMARNIPTSVQKNQLVSWYQFAADSGHHGLASLCGDFIKWNFEMVSNTGDFGHLEPDQMLSFVQSSELVVKDEMTLYNCFCRWLHARQDVLLGAGLSSMATSAVTTNNPKIPPNCSSNAHGQSLLHKNEVDQHIDLCVRNILPHIRFPMMTSSQLADLLLTPLSKSHTDLLVDRIRLAMSFHKNQVGQLAEFGYCSGDKDRGAKLIPLRGGDRIFSPRLYTADRFSASLSIDCFKNILSYHCRSLLFCGQKHLAEHRGSPEESVGWVVDVFPKGVWIQRCLTVYNPSGLEVPERVMKTVRVSVSTQTEETLKVRIGVLVMGNQDGLDHIRAVATRNYFFSKNDQIVNFDDVVDFDELNGADLAGSGHRKSPFLTGPNRDSLKFQIVIAPLDEYSSLS